MVLATFQVLRSPCGYCQLNLTLQLYTILVWSWPAFSLGGGGRGHRAPWLAEFYFIYQELNSGPQQWKCQDLTLDCQGIPALACFWTPAVTLYLLCIRLCLSWWTLISLPASHSPSLHSFKSDNQVYTSAFGPILWQQLFGEYISQSESHGGRRE